MSREEEKSESFRVEDKRRFTQEGEVKKEAEAIGSKEEASETSKENASDSGKQKLPPIDFATFILSLASSVQVHLGLVPNPNDEKVSKNLEMAKQTIDILGMLEEKTKGNLKEEEEKLLQHILTDLRLRYVEVNK